MSSVFKQHKGLLSYWVDTIRIKKIVRSIEPESKVLDIGCGSALLLKYLPYNCSYYGVDIDPVIIEELCLAYPKKDFLVLDVCKRELPFIEPEFDFIVMGAFLEHIDNLNLVFSEVSRVLKINGKLIATTPAGAGIFLHGILANLRLLSKDAAEEHKGAILKNELYAVARKYGLDLILAEKFEFGMNQLFIFQRK